MSVDEFDAIPFEDRDASYRYELIDGVLVVSPTASIEERDPNGELDYLLRRYRDEHPQGAALDATVMEHELKIGDQRRRADRAIWTGLGRLPDPEVDFPSILVEFVSPGRVAWLRDYEQKRREYLGAGAVEYWVIDRFRRLMTVHRATASGFSEQVVPADGTYQTDRLPGFELPLARLLELSDRWGRP
jgi:Uma2 family endonuclease